MVGVSVYLGAAYAEIARKTIATMMFERILYNEIEDSGKTKMKGFVKLIVGMFVSRYAPYL